MPNFENDSHVVLAYDRNIKYPEWVTSKFEGSVLTVVDYYPFTHEYLCKTKSGQQGRFKEVWLTRYVCGQKFKNNTKNEVTLEYDEMLI